MSAKAMTLLLLLPFAFLVSCQRSEKHVLEVVEIADELQGIETSWEEWSCSKIGIAAVVEPSAFR